MAEDVFGIVGSVLVGAYKVETVVAEGGFGVVYRAFHSGFRAPVAVKCLKIPQQLGQRHQAEFLEQFRAEAELLFRLSASIPTVVRPLHVDAVTTQSGIFMPFMALEWLEGETLDAIVERRRRSGQPPFTLRKLFRLLTPVARALERAHNFVGPDGPISIVHRDLKPENIFVANVAGEEVVKILDFGIGKAKSVASQVAGKASQTQSGLSSFTPAYGAPEQWVPKRFGQTGPWTDVWGLALTMVEVMAARAIIDGDQAAMMGTTLDAQRRPTPRAEGVEVSDAVEAVFLRALAVDPRDRQADAGVFWNELQAAIGVGAADRTSSVPPRDRRSEGGAVPRQEQVNMRSVGPAAPARPSPAPRVDREAETIAREAVDFAPVNPPAIPDLALDEAPRRHTPARQRRTSSSGSRPLAPPANKQDVEFDDSVDSVGDIKLDLPPDEQRPTARTSVVPSRRVSGPYPAVTSASVGAPRHTPREAPVVSERSGRALQASPVSVPAAPHASFRPSPAPHVSTRPTPGAARPVSAADALGDEKPSLARRIMPGVLLLVLSILLPIVDQAYASSYGEVLAIGPLRIAWLAAAFMLAGVGLLVYRLVIRR